MRCGSHGLREVHRVCGAAAVYCASSDDYVAIFTPNATGALKLLGESYLFDSDARLLLSADNHTR